MSFWDYEPIQAPLIQDSPVESEAFGLSITRANYSVWQGIDDALNTVLVSSDLVILRTRDAVPFVELKGFTVIPAGVLTYWTSEKNPRFGFASNDYELLREASDDFLPDFSSVLRDSFSQYKNHYDFNPALRGLSTTDAYVDWAISRVNTDAITGLLTFEQTPIGVVSAVQNGDEVEIELAGIASGAQGHGHYKHLIAKLWSVVDHPESSRLVISTQIENRNVQSAWSKIGLTPAFEVHTTHVMRKTANDW